MGLLGFGDVFTENFGGFITQKILNLVRYLLLHELKLEKS
jgi:hypothetical protein